jgi:hypothetical protein
MSGWELRGLALYQDGLVDLNGTARVITLRQRASADGEPSICCPPSWHGAERGGGSLHRESGYGARRLIQLQDCQHSLPR